MLVTFGTDSELDSYEAIGQAVFVWRWFGQAGESRACRELQARWSTCIWRNVLFLTKMPHSGRAGLGWRDPSLATVMNSVELRSHATPAHPTRRKPTGRTTLLSGGLETGPLGYQTGSDVSSQSDQELTGKGDRGDLAHTPAHGADPLGEPAREGTIRLIAEP